jgi:hypothetical protein
MAKAMPPAGQSGQFLAVNFQPYFGSGNPDFGGTVNLILPIAEADKYQITKPYTLALTVQS